jgi:hypothetical protein
VAQQFGMPAAVAVAAKVVLMKVMADKAGEAVAAV